MPRARVWTLKGIQGVPLAAMARVRHNGALITQAAISSVSVTIQRYNGGDTEEITPPSLTVAGTVFDALQTDDRWTADDTGYNFLATIAGEYFADPDEYWIVFVFNPTSGGDFVVICRATILPNMGALP